MPVLNQQDYDDLINSDVILPVRLRTATHTLQETLKCENLNDQDRQQLLDACRKVKDACWALRQVSRAVFEDTCRRSLNHQGEATN